MRHAMRKMIFLAVCAAPLGLTSCVGAFDPFQRPYQWSVTGAANETIAQQAANPSDLLSGESDPTTNGIVAAGGIDKALGAGGVGSASGLQTAITASSSTSSITVGQ